VGLVLEGSETNCWFWFVRGLRNLVFVGLKVFFFLALGSLASSSSRAAKMSAMMVCAIERELSGEADIEVEVEVNEQDVPCGEGES
jgi:hypothetical protein